MPGSCVHQSRPFRAQRTCLFFTCSLSHWCEVIHVSCPGGKIPWTDLRPATGPAGPARSLPLTLPRVSAIDYYCLALMEPLHARPYGERGCCGEGRHVWRPSLIPIDGLFVFVHTKVICIKGCFHKSFYPHKTGQVNVLYRDATNNAKNVLFWE